MAFGPWATGPCSEIVVLDTPVTPLGLQHGQASLWYQINLRTLTDAHPVYH